MPVDSYTYCCTYGPMVLRRCRKLLGDEQTGSVREMAGVRYWGIGIGAIL